MIIYSILYVRYCMRFEYILIISLKNLLFVSALFFNNTQKREISNVILLVLFLFHVLFSQRVCLLESYFQIYEFMQKCFTYFSYISGMARYIYFQKLELFSPLRYDTLGPRRKTLCCRTTLSIGEICLHSKVRFSY